VLGSPIRTPWDHSLVDSSPRPIAASHVLHRLLMPRHPPFALCNLTYRKQRCSRPLCNSQPTTNPQPHGLAPNLGAITGFLKWYTSPGRAWAVLKQQLPAPQGLPVVLSGPNRVLIIDSQPHQRFLFLHRLLCVYSDRRPLPDFDSPVSPPVSTPI
jgi:hypothetical protein